MAVFLCQAQHGVLHDVQRRFLVAQREQGLAEDTPLHAGEKVGEFDAGSQSLPCLPVICKRATLT